MAGRPLRSATDRRLGGPLPRQLANQTRAHPIPPEFLPLCHAAPRSYAVLAVISNCYPPVWGRLPTRYSPVRRSVKPPFLRRFKAECFARLACVKHAASVHPEPGSNSRIKDLGSVSHNPYVRMRSSTTWQAALPRAVSLVSQELHSNPISIEPKFNSVQENV